MMAKTLRLSLSTVADLLGWNGVYLLTLILAITLFLVNLEACPCTGHIPYGIFMLGLPAISVYMAAVFVYYRLSDCEVPWKVIKNYQESKRPCTFCNHGNRLDVRSGDGDYCQACQRRWRNTKLGGSFLLSLVYPLFWLSLGFIRTNYFVCANVGPSPSGPILQYCTSWKVDYESYRKDYTLAGNTSVITGGLIFVVTLSLIAVFVIVYGELAAKVENNDYESPGPLQAQLTVGGETRQWSGTSSDRSAHDKPEEGHYRPQGHRAGEGGSVYIEVQRDFYASLQSCLEEGRGASVTLCCSENPEEQRRRAAGSRDDSRVRQRDNFGACAYEKMPVA